MFQINQKRISVCFACKFLNRNQRCIYFRVKYSENKGVLYEMKVHIFNHYLVEIQTNFKEILKVKPTCLSSITFISEINYKSHYIPLLSSYNYLAPWHKLSIIKNEKYFKESSQVVHLTIGILSKNQI